VDELLAMIADERRRVAALVETLTEQQLATPSLCGQWTVKDVAGHLLAAVAAPRRLLVQLLIRSGLRVHRANAEAARIMARRPARELAAGLRDNAENPFRPPVVGHIGQLTDLLVHGLDMRRPLGVGADVPADRLVTALDFLVAGPAVGFVPRRRRAGLRFEAPDLGWGRGQGPVVRAPAEDLMLALTGRTIALQALQGDGAPILTSRLRG